MCGPMKERPMKTLISTAIAISIVSLAAAQSAKAADLVYRDRSPYYSREVTGPTYAAGPCPVDILCYIREYPGFRGDPYYANCHMVRVRETMHDGTIVIRRGRTC